jgi:hypothetical protein
MPPAGFEPTISAGERPQTHVLDGEDTGIGLYTDINLENFEFPTPVNKPNKVRYSIGQQNLLNPYPANVENMASS